MNKKALVVIVVILAFSVISSIIDFNSDRQDTTGGRAPNNGYYQTTNLDIKGIQGKCYGTLLSRKASSGPWTSKAKLEVNVPDQVKDFFLNHKDKDGFFFLRYLQDVSGGTFFWHTNPPEEFKILLYFPDTDTYYTSEILTRYSLASRYTVTVGENGIEINKNNSYVKVLLVTLLRTALMVLAAVAISSWMGRPYMQQWRKILLINGVVLLIFNILVSLYSFKNGFGRLEYIVIVWLFFIPFVPIFGSYYAKKARTISSPYYSAFGGCAAAYVVGLLLIDVFPNLFVIF